MVDSSPLRPVVFLLNSLIRGGMEQMVLALSRSLLRRGRYRPVIACLAEPGPLAGQVLADGIDLHANLLHHKYDLPAIGRLRRMFAGDPAAVVIVNPGGDRMFYAALARGPRGRRPPLVLWTQRTPLPGRRLIEPANRLLIGRLDAIAVLGPQQAEAYAMFEHLPAGRMHVVPNGLEVERIERLSARSTRDAVRAEFGAAPGERVVMCVANPRPIKRVDLFCRAAATLLARRADLPLRFWLAGDGPGRAELDGLAGELNLAAPWFVRLGMRTDVDRLWPAADIGACCSDSEGLSVSMLEAMAAGVPFVSTAVGEHPTVIADGETGLLTPAGSADALADAIERLADDDSLRARLARAAADRLREHYTMERSAELFEKMIDGL